MFGSSDGIYRLSSVGVIGIDEVKYIVEWKSRIYVINGEVYLFEKK